MVSVAAMNEPPIAAKPLDSDASSLASTVDPDSRRSSIGQLTSGELRAFVLTERRTMQEREVYFREEVRAARERAEADREEVRAAREEVRASRERAEAARVRAEAARVRAEAAEAAAAIERARADAALRRTCCAIA